MCKYWEAVIKKAEIIFPGFTVTSYNPGITMTKVMQKSSNFSILTEQTFTISPEIVDYIFEEISIKNRAVEVIKKAQEFGEEFQFEGGAMARAGCQGMVALLEKFLKGIEQ
jgi:hypothetical protein